MSGLDQPIVIANSNYHVGQERSFRVAEEQGYLKEEGLDRYVYERGGLIPGELEFEGLGQIMWERGVDIATAVDAGAAVVQRARAADVYIVGGWRMQLAPTLIGSKGMTGPESLRGAIIGVREKWGLNHLSIAAALRKLGIDPEAEIEWIEDPLIGYGSAGVGDILRSGRVTVLPLNPGRESDRLLSEGYPVVLDLARFYLERGAWPPGKVIVVTQQTVEQRGEELRAFLRANLRAFWFVQNPQNHAYMYDLDTRLRESTYNEDERKLRMYRDEAPAPSGEKVGARAMGYMAMDGLVARPALAEVIDTMVQTGHIERAIAVDDVLKDAASLDAYEQLVKRGVINAQMVERWRGGESPSPSGRGLG
jgi:ABC-type nitrate/sulfonate/bicarbonate transport system substrate-binding protein